MLRSTFIHIDGIAHATEQRLWRAGFEDWHALLAYEGELDGVASHGYFREQVAESIERLESGHHQFFARPLGLREAWRAFHDFRDSCVYLDIETDGGQSGDSITTIGMYDGVQYTCLVKGSDLENFRDAISKYSMIVTFFGSGFDLPMLNKRFRGLDLDQIHIDLCPTLRQVGLRGGLKKIEKQLGIGRSDETDGLNGLDAVRLWRRYDRFGDDAALETLIAYNREDVVNLEHLAEYAYSHLWRATRATAELATT